MIKQFIVKTKEYTPNGEFLRFNFPPIPPIPDDATITWIGQNDKCGLIEIETADEQFLTTGYLECQLEEVI